MIFLGVGHPAVRVRVASWWRVRAFLSCLASIFAIALRGGFGILSFTGAVGRLSSHASLRLASPGVVIFR